MVENYWQPLGPASTLMNESLHRQPGKYVCLIKWRRSCAKGDGLMQQELDLRLTPRSRSPHTDYLLLQRRKAEIKNSFIHVFSLFFCMQSAFIIPLTFTSHSVSLVELERSPVPVPAADVLVL